MCQPKSYEKLEAQSKRIAELDMSVLANTQQKLLQTSALIAKEKQSLALSPEVSGAIRSSIRSLEKMRLQLESDYQYLKNENEQLEAMLFVGPEALLVAGSLPGEFGEELKKTTVAKLKQQAEYKRKQGE